MAFKEQYFSRTRQVDSMQLQIPYYMYACAFTNPYEKHMFTSGRRFAIAYSKTCVKPSLKIDKTKILNTNGSLMKVKSIAEYSPWSILLYI